MERYHIGLALMAIAVLHAVAALVPRFAFDDTASAPSEAVRRAEDPGRPRKDHPAAGVPGKQRRNSTNPRPMRSPAGWSRGRSSASVLAGTSSLPGGRRGVGLRRPQRACPVGRVSPCRGGASRRSRLALRYQPLSRGVGPGTATGSFFSVIGISNFALRRFPVTLQRSER